MHNEVYQGLLLRFAKELFEVGVSEDLRKLVEAQYTRTPNLVAASANEDTKKFVYRHNGYEIEAVQNVKITVKKCT
tara:strand:- start:523 stop:750 length:228 start_codon:yes stop_codon:yes gene_type:complete